MWSVRVMCACGSASGVGECRLRPDSSTPGRRPRYILELVSWLYYGRQPARERERGALRRDTMPPGCGWRRPSAALPVYGSGLSLAQGGSTMDEPLAPRKSPRIGRRSRITATIVFTEALPIGAGLIDHSDPIHSLPHRHGFDPTPSRQIGHPRIRNRSELVATRAAGQPIP